MQLLEYYIISLFQLFELPLASDLCVASAISSYCQFNIYLLNVVSIVALLAIVFSASRVRLALKLIIISPLTILYLFWITDNNLSQLSAPESFGQEPYFQLFHLWLIFIFVFSAVSLFNILKYNKKIYLFMSLLAFIYAIVLGYFGAGSNLQYESLSGGLFYTYNISTIVYATYIKILLYISVAFLIILLLVPVSEWVETANISLHKVKALCYSYLRIIFLALIIYLSLFVGEFVNGKQVSAAKSYIDKLVPEVEGYFYENNQYPPQIFKLVDNKARNYPYLLSRHEFFSAGIPATYYFSRPEKYCFVFQNPARDFGYYSYTKKRGWNFTLALKGLDDVLISLCDEDFSSYQSLMAQHLGIEGVDDIVKQFAYEFDTPISPAMSLEATSRLHEKILEEGQKDPEIFKYYANPPK